MADTPEALLEQYASALRQQNLDAAVGCFTENAVVMAQGVPTASGSAAVRELYGQIVGALRLDITFTVEATLAGADGRIAVFTHSRGTQTDGAGGDSAEANREAFVLVPGADGLRIGRYLFNTEA